MINIDQLIYKAPLFISTVSFYGQSYFNTSPRRLIFTKARRKCILQVYIRSRFARARMRSLYEEKYVTF